MNVPNFYNEEDCHRQHHCYATSRNNIQEGDPLSRNGRNSNIVVPPLPQLKKMKKQPPQKKNKIHYYHYYGLEEDETSKDYYLRSSSRELSSNRNVVVVEAHRKKSTMSKTNSSATNGQRKFRRLKVTNKTEKPNLKTTSWSISSNQYRLKEARDDSNSSSLSTTHEIRHLQSPPKLSRLSKSKTFKVIKSLPIEEEEEKHDDTLCGNFPVQTHHHPALQQQRLEMTFSRRNYLAVRYHEIIGHPSLNIHRLRLPSDFFPLLEQIVSGCERHASLLEYGWETELYSLTKQDIALRDIPQVYNIARPIMSFVKRVAMLIYGFKSLKVDRNQPHVLKYSAEAGEKSHTGVELHHDKCDITINLMLSKSCSYDGGGTYFPEANQNVRLQYGEFLLHPGNCVHSGVDIRRGTRHLMVAFANERK